MWICQCLACPRTGAYPERHGGCLRLPEMNQPEAWTHTILTTQATYQLLVPLNHPLHSREGNVDSDDLTNLCYAPGTITTCCTAVRTGLQKCLLLGSDGAGFEQIYVAQRAPQGAQWRGRLQAKQETWVCFLDREDPLEEEMATHFNILDWKIP